MCADDTTFSFEGRNLTQAMHILNPGLEKISLWLYRNQLALNVLKTHYLCSISQAQKLLSGTLDSLFVVSCSLSKERVCDFRFLGANLDLCLKFKLHIHDAINKLVRVVPIF